jgi:hypothetical protein
MHAGDHHQQAEIAKVLHVPGRGGKGIGGKVRPGGDQTGDHAPVWSRDQVNRQAEGSRHADAQRQRSKEDPCDQGRLAGDFCRQQREQGLPDHDGKGDLELGAKVGAAASFHHPIAEGQGDD